MTTFYLASASPRRAELLDQLNIKYSILRLPATLEDEPRFENESPQDYVLRTAIEKSERAIQYIQSKNLELLPIITADTTVFIEQHIYGKPSSKEEVFQTLKSLSGKSHNVHTAVVLRWRDKCLYRISQSQVIMTVISDEDIKKYELTGEPYGKAGGYAIQGLGAKFIESIKGSYSGIMGLPLYELTQLIQSMQLK